MSLIKCMECGKEFSDKAAACPNCGCPTEDATKQHITKPRVSVKPTKSVGASPQKTNILRDYLEKARILETDLYTFDKILEELPKQKMPIGEKPKALVAPIKPEPVALPIKPEEKSDKIFSYALKSAVAFVGAYVLSFVLYGTGIEDLLAVIGIICFFAAPVLFVWSMILSKQEEPSIEKYKKASETYRNYEERLSLYEKDFLKYQNRQSEIAEYDKHFPIKIEFNKKLDEDISKTKANRDKTLETLTHLYDQDVIYLKYRGLIPVTMFCEYIDSKRRTYLTGENGMYDLYETELLGKQIVGELQVVNKNLKEIGNKLDGISHQLVGIQRNQILLYEEVARGNSIAMGIGSELSAQKQAMNAMSGSLQAIQSSAELTAFNSKATKNSAEVLERIAAQTYSELRY